MDHSLCLASQLGICLGVRAAMWRYSLHQLMIVGLVSLHGNFWMMHGGIGSHILARWCGNSNNPRDRARASHARRTLNLLSSRHLGLHIRLMCTTTLCYAGLGCQHARQLVIPFACARSSCDESLRAALPSDATSSTAARLPTLPPLLRIVRLECVLQHRVRFGLGVADLEGLGLRIVTPPLGVPRAQVGVVTFAGE